MTQRGQFRSTHPAKAADAVIDSATGDVIGGS
jgi:hypothetical protein